jgi:urease accessory protein
MYRATRLERAGTWPARAARDSITLAFDDRHRRRIKLRTDQGADLLLDLAEATVLADGDGLALDDGGWIAVRATPEALLEVTAHGPAQLARLAWHIGNRHLQAQIERDRILIREDAVIADMLTRLGAHVHRVMAPFSPEGGAYDGHMPGYGHDPDGKPHSHHDHDHPHRHYHHGHGHDDDP